MEPSCSILAEPEVAGVVRQYGRDDAVGGDYYREGSRAVPPFLSILWWACILLASAFELF